MEGTIKIEAIPDRGISVATDLRHVSIRDRIEIIDAVVEALELDKREMQLVSLMLAMGGLSKIPGVETRKVELDKEALEMLKKKQEDKNNETDAH